jgi:hypothetical protein
MYSIKWDLIIENFPVDLSAEVSEYDYETLFRILLGKDSWTDFGASDLDAFKKLIYIVHTFRKVYSRLQYDSYYNYVQLGISNSCNIAS